MFTPTIANTCTPSLPQQKTLLFTPSDANANVNIRRRIKMSSTPLPNDFGSGDHMQLPAIREEEAGEEERENENDVIEIDPEECEEGFESDDNGIIIIEEDSFLFSPSKQSQPSVGGNINSDQECQVDSDQERLVDSDQPERLVDSDQPERLVDSDQEGLVDSDQEGLVDSDQPERLVDSDQERQVDSDQGGLGDSDQEGLVDSDQEVLVDSDQEHLDDSDQERLIDREQEGCQVWQDDGDIGVNPVDDDEGSATSADESCVAYDVPAQEHSLISVEDM